MLGRESERGLLTPLCRVRAVVCRTTHLLRRLCSSRSHGDRHRGSSEESRLRYNLCTQAARTCDLGDDAPRDWCAVGGRP
jgi:hypothetical protein